MTALREGSAGIRQKVELEGEEKVYGLTVTGGFDFAADKGHLAVDLPGGAIDHSDQIFANGKIYLSGAHEIAEDAWGVLPRDKAEAHYLLRAPLNDPEHVLEQIAAMRKVSREGEENIQGVRAVHYRGILDHRTVTLRMAQDVRTKMDQARDTLGSDLPVFADAWVDGRGRLVQTRMSVNMAGARSTLTMTLSDIGEPVRVTVPRAADTVPVSEVGGILNG
ncbi:LppX_LprAFG lipoprotein [Streptomyces sp. SID7499]|uniref:LppX_LprAFG lipoprotein n=1 Tax=Streptomyces sp. SID7499 TaxID=2706086 RepID=A0A6G3XYX9_9ACTN|nr:LppX_LprAFG lipoprotein [Streptomyces sp. SID7499]